MYFFQDKNINSIILSKLNDEDLFNFCNLKINIDETFWRNRTVTNFPKFTTPLNRTWKRTYLALVYYSNKYTIDRNTFNEIIEKLAAKGYTDLLNYFIQKGEVEGYNFDWNWGLQGAAKGGNRNLVDFFIEKGGNQWNSGIRGAALGGHRELIDFFIEKGAKDWDYAMGSASEGGDRELVDLFIEKGSTNWGWGIQGAAKGGHRELVDFFIEKSQNEGYIINWNFALLSACEGGHKDLVEIFIEKGASHWDWGIQLAAQEGHKVLVDFFKQKIHNL